MASVGIINIAQQSMVEKQCHETDERSITALKSMKMRKCVV